VGGEDLGLEVPLLEEAVLAAEEDVGDDGQVALRRRLPAVDQRLANLERLTFLEKIVVS
jgi:hypothetical protein